MTILHKKDALNENATRVSESEAALETEAIDELLKL